MCVESGLPLLWNFWKPGNVREFCKDQGKVREKYKVREGSGNLCSQGYLNWHNACDVHGHMLRTSYNLPVLYSYFNLFCISDVQRFELTLVSC